MSNLLIKIDRFTKNLLLQQKPHQKMASNRPIPVSIKRNVNFQLGENAKIYGYADQETPRTSRTDQKSTGAIRKQLGKPILKESNHRTERRPENFCDLTPRSKAAVMPAITRALNFPPHEKVFGNLISLNVNDSLLPERVPIRKKYVIKGPKHPEPDLQDFLKPVAPLTHTIPEPDLEITVPDVEFNNFQKYKDFCKEAYGDEW